MDILIREAGLEDASDILQLISEHAVSSNERSPLSAEYVAHYLASPVSTLLVAEAGKQVIGLLSFSLRPDLYHAGDACLIEELIVTENAREQWVGKALMVGLFSYLAGSRVVEIVAALIPDNTRAIRFFHSHGLCQEALLLERHICE